MFWNKQKCFYWKVNEINQYKNQILLIKLKQIYRRPNNLLQKYYLFINQAQKLKKPEKILKIQ